MKTGTDAILLGSWCNVENVENALDIGSGSGIISLFVAARSQAKVTAVEIDTASVEESGANFDASPFAERMQVINTNVNDFHTEQEFDLIVSNPPFFTDDLHSPDRRKTNAEARKRLQALLLVHVARRQPERLLTAATSVEPLTQASDAGSVFGVHCEAADHTGRLFTPGRLRELLVRLAGPCSNDVFLDRAHVRLCAQRQTILPNWKGAIGREACLTRVADVFGEIISDCEASQAIADP